MEMLKFFMAMNPPTATAQEKFINTKTGKIGMKTEARAARSKLLAHLAEYRPETPFTGPVHVEIGWLYKNDSKEELSWNISKPDLDNLEKDLLDCMTKLKFWKDDSQVCMKYTEKRWTQSVPGIAIMVEELE